MRVVEGDVDLAEVSGIGLRLVGDAIIEQAHADAGAQGDDDDFLLQAR